MTNRMENIEKIASMKEIAIMREIKKHGIQNEKLQQKSNSVQIINIETMKENLKVLEERK